MVQWLRLRPPNAGDMFSTPGQGTRFHMPQLKTLQAATKTQRSQTAFFFFLNKQIWIARFATFKAKSQTYITIYKIDNQWEFFVWFRGTQAWCSVTIQRGGMRTEMGGRFEREGTYGHLWMIRADVWQKPAQYCKASMFQLKINKFF